MLPHAGTPLPSGTRWIRTVTEEVAANAKGFFWNALGGRFFCTKATADACGLKSERPA